jgi:hypothetical protein
MKEGLAALTKFVKVVMSYRPDRAQKAKPHPRRIPKKKATAKSK